MNHLRKFFPSCFIAATLAAILLSSGCSSSTSVTTNEGTITMKSSLTTSDVNRAMQVKGPTPASVDFDSIVVTNALVFVSNVKLHSDMDDTDSDTHDQTIKTGPFVLVFDSSGEHVVTTASIPAGTYDRVKFEFHHPNKNADAAILAQYPQLQNGGQTYNVWIYGYTWKDGVPTSFSVVSLASKNVMLRFEDNALKNRDNFVLNANSTATLLFELDPRIVFHLNGILTGGTLLDPRDLTITNQGDIDNNILVAIRVVEF